MAEQQRWSLPVTDAGGGAGVQQLQLLFMVRGQSQELLHLSAKEALAQAWLHGFMASLPWGVRIYVCVNVGPGCSP